MKKNKWFGLALVATMMGASFSACSNEAEEVLAQESEIKLTSEITPSRVTDLNYQSTQIVRDQQVGVTISGAKTDHNNVPWKAGEEGALENTRKPIYWGSQNTIDITAYHPYNENWIEANQEFSVNTNQSGYYDYLNSDLLFANSSDVARSADDTPISLTFNHKLAKINITLEGSDDLRNAKVYICGTNITTNFNKTTGVLTDVDEPNIQDIYTGSGTKSSVIIIPQVVNKNTKFIKVINNDKIYYYTLPENKTFDSGNKYEFALTVQDATLVTLRENINDWIGTEDNNSTGNAEVEMVFTKTVTVEEAGTLSTLIPVNEQKTITTLTVSGPLNGTDIAFLRSLSDNTVESACLYELDLSNASIVAGGSPYRSSFTTAANIIGREMFTALKLESLILPNNITTIGSLAFTSSPNLTNITIPNSVTQLDDAAFGVSNISSIVIPKSVTSISHSMFLGCVNLTSIIVDEENSHFTSGDNCNAILTKDGTVLVAGCKSSIIPNTVTEIFINAFYGIANLTSIEIPNSVTTIGSSAFESTDLTSITLPNSVTNIGNSAFSSCSYLKTVICESATPPTLGTSVFTSSPTVYVPTAAAVNTYKAAEGWKDLTIEVKQ